MRYLCWTCPSLYSCHIYIYIYIWSVYIYIVLVCRRVFAFNWKSKYIPESRASDFEGTDLILPDRGMEYWFKWILSQRRFFKFLCSKFVSIKMHEYAWVLPNGVNPNDLMCIRYQMNSQLLDQKTAWFWLTSTICYIHVHNHIINHIINHKTHVITITPLGAFFAISPAPKIDGPCLGTVAGHVQRHRDVHQPRWRRCHAGGNLKNPWRILTVLLYMVTWIPSIYHHQYVSIYTIITWILYGICKRWWKLRWSGWW